MHTTHILFIVTQNAHTPIKKIKYRGPSPVWRLAPGWCTSAYCCNVASVYRSACARGSRISKSRSAPKQVFRSFLFLFSNPTVTCHCVLLYFRNSCIVLLSRTSSCILCQTIRSFVEWLWLSCLSKYYKSYCWTLMRRVWIYSSLNVLLRENDST